MLPRLPQRLATLADDVPRASVTSSRRRVVTAGLALPVAALAAQAFRAAPALAAFSIGTSVVVDTDRLNLRTGPSTGNSVIKVLVQGARASVIGRPANGSNDGIDWYRIETAAGDRGWVAGEFLAAAASSGSGSRFAIGSVVQVSSDNLNLRSAAKISAPVRDSLDTGDRAVVLDGPVSRDGYVWYRLDTDVDGKSNGWAVSTYLAKPSGGFPNGSAVRVADGPVNVRKTAGLSGTLIDTVDEGELFQVRGGPTTKDGYTWIKVFNYGTGEGWLAGEFVIAEPDGFPGEDGSGAVG